jgi:hypothetical protein
MFYQTVLAVSLLKTLFLPCYRGAIHQLLNIILQLRILVLLLVSTLSYVVKS